MSIVKIEDVATISRGASPRPINKYLTSNKTGINWIKIGDVDDGSVFISHTEEKITIEGASKSRFVKKGDFVLSNSMSFGRPYILNIDGCVHDGWLILSGYEKFMIQKYFYYVLKSKNTQNQFLKYAQGATVKNLNSDIVKKTTIRVYDIYMQQNIVNNLDCIFDMIDKRKKQMDLLSELVKSRFIEMFELYEKVQLFKIATIIMGQSPDSKSYNDNGKGMPFFQGKADYGDKYTKVRHWTTEPSKIVEENTILMSVRAPVGPVNIASVKCCLGRGLCGINAINGKTNNEFLYNALKVLEEDISQKGTGSTFKAITKNDVYEILIPNAPINKQDEFSAFSQQIDKSKFILQQQIKSLQELLDKKMDEYFGE